MFKYSAPMTSAPPLLSLVGSAACGPSHVALNDAKPAASVVALAAAAVALAFAEFWLVRAAAALAAAAVAAVVAVVDSDVTDAALAAAATADAWADAAAWLAICVLLTSI